MRGGGTKVEGNNPPLPPDFVGALSVGRQIRCAACVAVRRAELEKSPGGPPCGGGGPYGTPPACVAPGGVGYTIGPAADKKQGGSAQLAGGIGEY